jgi:hypothetical protein
MIHRLAFRFPAAQDMLLDMEASRFAKAIDAQPLNAPIFVTSLPRAGTTVLLELLALSPDAVSFTHRDMPFVQSPAIWRKMTSAFHVDREKAERSHGDGLMVNSDSPEAFEEAIWLKLLRDDFAKSGIRERDSLPQAFAKSLSRTMKALIVSRKGMPDPAARYLSKNNANIARLPALTEQFIGAPFLVPLRHPLDQARSLIATHLRAKQSQQEDSFALAYARDIGHFEFGLLHKPIMFDGMDKVIAQFDPDGIDYWLAYWICAYEAISKHRMIRFVDMADFTQRKPVRALFDFLGLRCDATIEQAGQALIRPMKPRDDHSEAGDPALIQEAVALYEKLQASDLVILRD